MVREEGCLWKVFCGLGDLAALDSVLFRWLQSLSLKFSKTIEECIQDLSLPHFLVAETWSLWENEPHTLLYILLSIEVKIWLYKITMSSWQGHFTLHFASTSDLTNYKNFSQFFQCISAIHTFLIRSPLMFYPLYVSSLLLLLFTGISELTVFIIIIIITILLLLYRTVKVHVVISYKKTPSNEADVSKYKTEYTLRHLLHWMGSSC